jgi:acetylornithine deacetylase/succinyl-diaminopimelate desuccinylase-like protein
MKWFVTTTHFHALHAGFGMDEGVPTPFPQFAIFNAERSNWWIKIMVKGVTGHGSMMPQGTAMQRFLLFAERVYAFRQSQMSKLRSVQELGEVVSVNITMIKVRKQGDALLVWNTSQCHPGCLGGTLGCTNASLRLS